MADLLILSPPDKKSAAAEIARASRAAGFDAELVDAGAPETLTEHIRAAPAALLLWSRPLAAWAMENDRIGGLRQHPNLIEVSTDGIAPDTGEAGKVVLLSGWRGQPHHLGWQQIVGRLERLVAARTIRPAKHDSAAAPAASPRPPMPRRAMLVLALGVTALAALAAAILWSGSPAPQVERTGPQAPPTAPVASPPVPAATPVAAPAAAEPVQAIAVPAEPIAEPAPTRTESPAAAAPRPATRHRSGAGPTKHYSRRNSKVMRQFCAGSGRSTPQCRTFLRSMRGG